MLKRYVSISLRLTLWFGAIFFCGWVIFGIAMWLNLRHTLTAERHLTLSRRADRLEDVLRHGLKNNISDRAQDFTDFAHATGNGLVEVFNTGGGRLYPAPSSAAASFPWPSTASISTEQFLSTRLRDQSYWVLVRPAHIGDQSVYLAMAAPDAGNVLVLEGFRWGLLASFPLLLLISSAAGYWISRKALRPVDRITAAARSISIRNLSERLPVQQSGDELQRLTETCNAMLSRLESSVKTMKQFTADASHELRGPLSFTRTVSEVALRNPRINAESREAFQDIIDEAARAAHLLDQMLTLARADAEPFTVPLAPIHLEQVIEETCSFAQGIARERHMTLELSLPVKSVGLVLGDVSSIRRLLWILLDNSLKYIAPHGRISVALASEDGNAVLSVEDTGPGIAAADLPRIFDRFYRADPSRSEVEGNGLGLAIARWIADTHHAELSVVSTTEKGTRFEVTFPLSNL